jgi:hypothetical protein
MTPFSVIIYINGVLFYPNSVTVTATRNDLARFSVVLPAVPEFELLPPRSHCVVFYTDHVSQLWRMMVEGEYIGVSKSKTSDGHRHTTLEFRSLFGIIQSATNTNLSSLAFRSTDVAKDALIMMGTGRQITSSGSKLVDTPTTLSLVSAFDNPQATASVLFPILMESILKRIPVEGYYWEERRIKQKLFALPDFDIVSTVTPVMFKQMSEFYSNMLSQEGQTILSLMKDYENLIFYQHIPMLSPPEYAEAGIIPEMLFTPELLNVVPPACNVVFSDQIAELSYTRDFANEPTRVILKLGMAEGKSVPVIYMANNVIDSKDVGLEARTTYNAHSPSIGATHDLYSPDELHRGVVIAPPISVNYTQFSPNSTSSSDWTFYYDQAARYYYSKEQGNYRNANLSCVFLPYILPGVPCLVEDYTSPFHAHVESITHVLSNDAAPRTLLTLSQVRPAYVHGSRNKTPPIPNWVNHAFAPSGIRGLEKKKGTWELLLGRNRADLYGEARHGAMVPPDKLVVSGTSAADTVAFPKSNGTTTYNFNKEQINMDAIASEVIPVPIYDEKLQSAKFSSGTIAEKLRTMPEPHFAMQAYNWRQGISVTQYARFHNVPVDGFSDVITQGATPPATLFKQDNSVDGTPLFSSPANMQFTGDAASKYGVAELVRGQNSGALHNPVGQRAALLAAAAINRRITRC